MGEQAKQNNKGSEAGDTAKSRLVLLVEALGDAKVSVRWNAARELGRMGEAAADALPTLTGLLDDRDGTTSLWARVAIARITGDMDSHLPTLMNALQTKARLFPGMAAAALSELGVSAAPAVPLLIVDLNAPSPDDRWSAAGALAAIGTEARSAVPALADVLEHDADEKVRWYAAHALAALGSESAPAVPALLRALDDVDEDVRGYAARALNHIGAQHIAQFASLPEVAARLRALLPEEDGQVRAEMEAVLRKVEEDTRYEIRDTR